MLKKKKKKKKIFLVFEGKTPTLLRLHVSLSAMNRSRSLSTKRRKPDSVSSQDSSSSEGGKSISDNQKKRAKTTSDPPITIRDHFGKAAAAADKRNISSAATAMLSTVWAIRLVPTRVKRKNRDIMRLMMAMNKDWTKNWTRTEQELSWTVWAKQPVERLQGEVFDLKQENTKLSAELDTVQEERRGHADSD